MANFQAEYEALTSGRGYVELKNWSTVTMTGEDRQSFLHNMCTNDIRGLPVGDRCEAFCTDVQGKIVAPIFVTAREDRLELLMVPGQAEAFIAHLDRYIIREEVTLTDATSEYEWQFVGSGETASELAECFSLNIEGGAEGSVACCQEAWEAVRIEASLPLFGVDFDSSNLPQEVNRDAQAIHFNKGCYLGQETIARIDALGHVNKKVVLLKFAGKKVPPVGLELSVAGKNVGRVTSACWSPRFKAPLALAMVRRKSNELGSQLESEFGVATVVVPVE